MRTETPVLQSERTICVVPRTNMTHVVPTNATRFRTGSAVEAKYEQHHVQTCSRVMSDQNWGRMEVLTIE
jgi:hypothetical protein